MKKLFQNTTKVLNWGEVYYALKKGFIDVNFILHNYGTKRIDDFSEDIYIDLLIEVEESIYNVLEKIKIYVQSFLNVEIEHNELMIVEEGELDYIPQEFKFFWNTISEYVILRRIIKINTSVREKLYELYLHHSEVYYNDNWIFFINYYFSGSNVIDDSEVENKLINYFQGLRRSLFC